MAYIDRGNYNSSFTPDGFKDWLNRTNENVEVLRKKKFDNSIKGALAWRKYFVEYNVDTSIIYGKSMPIDPNPNPCQDPPPPQFNVVGPLLPVTWGQKCSYNDLCGLGQTFDCNTCNNGRPLTGCVATAIAQVLRYHQYPRKYNYSLMTPTSGNYNVQVLMRDAGLSVGMRYTCDYSWTFKQTIPLAFYNNFGFSSANFSDYSTYDFEKIKRNIATYGWPVIFGGSQGFNQPGHVWVCDGVSESTYYFGDCGISNSAATYLNFHMNWGWHEVDNQPDYNGWYAFDNWTINGQWNYQYNSFAVTELHP